MTERQKLQVGIWLLACAAMVCAMIMIGGATRLTESGLSMVDWQPIRGVIPPINVEEWQEELQNYRSSPEYQLKNRGMSLEEFKQIFWWEWGHRLAGRFMGLLFALPLVYFFVTGAVRGKLAWQCTGLLALGGAQGLIGWFMVQSGLVDVPYVSPVRLALHLSMAGLVLALLLWLAYSMLISRRHIMASTDRLALKGLPFTCVKKAGIVAIVILAVQIIYGALVAGWDAGLLYNSFPRMNESWLPDPLWNHDLGSASLWGHPDLVQFIHRWLAVLAVATIAAWHWALTPLRHASAAVASVSAAVIGLTLTQFALGVLTIINAVPIGLGLAHQITAFFMLAAMLLLMYITQNLASRQTG